VRKGGHFSLEQPVKKITGDTAQIWNLRAEVSCARDSLRTS
jgi:hypothetical protein